MRLRIFTLSCLVLGVCLASRTYAQPALSVTPVEVPPGGSVTVVVTGVPGQAWGIGGSFSGSGLVYAGLPLALGTDAVALGFGVLDASGSASLTFKPPIGPSTPLYYVQAITAADMTFAGAQPTQSYTLRPAGIFTNTPVLPQGLSAGHARIVDVSEPIVDTDAATKAYVDGVSGGVASQGAGGDLTGSYPNPGISPGAGANIVNAINATGGTIADARLPGTLARLNAANVFSAPATFSAGLSAANARVQFVGPPAHPMDAVNKLYVDATFAKLVGPNHGIQGDGGFYFGGAAGVGVIPATGPGVRIQWYPGKAAFRAGDIAGTHWDDVNVGYGSFAVGHNTIASGLVSSAQGDGVTVSGLAAAGFGGSHTVSGDFGFTAGSANVVSGTRAVALGFNNRAVGDDAIAIGDSVAACGESSIAIGQKVSTSSAPGVTPCGGVAHTGAILFGDGSTQVYFAAVANNEFAVRAAGGFRFRTNSFATTGCNLPAGSGVFACASDRNLKSGFWDVDGEDVLRKLAGIPVTRWRFTGEAAGVTHVGPMAQDFFAAFGLGDSDRMIGYTDINGINMRAIQALEARTRDLDAARDRIRELEARVQKLEAAVEALLPRQDNR